MMSLEFQHSSQGRKDLRPIHAAHLVAEGSPGRFDIEEEND